MIVEAMKEFSQAFRSARVENELTPEQLADMKDSLGTYYQSDFSRQYMDKNNGEAPNVAAQLETRLPIDYPLAA